MHRMPRRAVMLSVMILLPATDWVFGYESLTLDSLRERGVRDNMLARLAQRLVGLHPA